MIDSYEGKVPTIITDLASDLKNIRNQLIEASEKKDGRLNSTVHEDIACDFMENHPKWGTMVEIPSARYWYDFKLIDEYDKEYPINIKSTTGGTDNAEQLTGFLYALTDIPEKDLPKKVNDTTFDTLAKKHRCVDNNRDYYYMVFDKKNVGEIFVRGSKQIVNWKHNAKNGMQISWKYEWETPCPEFTAEQSWNNIYNGVMKCRQKLIKTIPDEWVLSAYSNGQITDELAKRELITYA